VLLRPLSFHDPERLVWISLQSEVPSGAIPITEFAAWRDQATSFERLVAYENTQDHTIQTDQAGTQTRNIWITSDFWALASVRPEFGRLPEANESDAVMLSHSFFVRWFDGDQSVIGRRVRVNGRDLAVTGVLPRDFRLHLPQEPVGPASDRKEADLYRQYGPIEPQERGRGPLVRVVGKLKTGIRLEEAYAELEAVRGRLAQVSPQPFLDRGTLTVVPLTQRLVETSRRALWVLLAAVAFVLLIGCANIANLLLARTTTRQREIAMRMSVGASRARVLRQFLTESLVLALLGGAAGLVLGRWIVDIIVGLVPQAAPRLIESTVLDGRVLAFTLGASVVSAALVGAAPVMMVDTGHTYDVLRTGATTVSASARSIRARHLLAGVELALAVVLLIGAALMLKSFWMMNAHPPGFAPERTLRLQVMFTAPGYLEAVRRRTFVDELINRLSAVPGVEAAGITTGGASPLTRFIIEGTNPDDPERRPTTPLNGASTGYMGAIGLRLLRGHWFGDGEPMPVVVITEGVARRDFGSDDPLGKRIRVPGAPGQTPIAATIVGIVEDLKYRKLDEDPAPEIYIPYRHHPTLLRFTVFVRTPSDPMAVAPAIRAVISGLDRTLPVFDAMTLEQILAESVAPRRFNLFLLSAFATAALLLALVGIYGLIAYLVVQRTHEIGIRMALGARALDVVRLVAQQSLVMIVGGLAAGLAAALVLTRVMGSLLYQVAPTDPQAFASVMGVMFVTALAACVGPTLKACLIDPLAALRCE
jgi:putative ABC transport system permease protein